MSVHFIGAGPGAPDLITVRGLNFIRRCPVVLYAGSLVPAEVVAEAPADARVIDTAPLNLDQIIEEMRTAHAAGREVARVHSGDPSLYGAIAEQIRRLDALAAAAAMARELTLPEISQTVVLTRTAVRSSPMPPGQDLKTIGATGATLAIHLSVNNLAQVVRDLTPLYGADCPVVVAYRVSWPDQAFVTGTLGDIRDKVKAAGFTRTALVMVGRVLGDSAFTDSRLYAADHSHILRPAHQQHGQG